MNTPETREQKINKLIDKYERELIILNATIKVKREHDSFGALFDMIEARELTKNIEMLKAINSPV